MKRKPSYPQPTRSRRRQSPPARVDVTVEPPPGFRGGIPLAAAQPSAPAPAAAYSRGGSCRLSLIEDAMRDEMLRQMKESVRRADGKEARRILGRASLDALETLSSALLTNGETLLTTAVARRDLDKVRSLVKYLDVCATNSEGETPLFKACHDKQWELASFLCRKGPSAANIQTRNSYTPLMEAAVCGAVDVVMVLLGHGAHTHIKDSNGFTALHWAAIGKHIEALRILIEGHKIQFVGDGLIKHWDAIEAFCTPWSLVCRASLVHSYNIERREMVNMIRQIFPSAIAVLCESRVKDFQSAVQVIQSPVFLSSVLTELVLQYLAPEFADARIEKMKLSLAALGN